MNKSELKRMKTTYKSLLVIGLGIISLTVSAQKDSTITRQVMLERDYVPTMQEASKVNTQPDIYAPTIKPKEIKFESNTPQIRLDNNKLGASASGDIKTDVAFDKKRGYAVLGLGTGGNIDGALGYRLVNGDNDRLDFFGTYSATGSTVDYINGSDYARKDVKAKYIHAGGNLKYQHTFDPSVLSVGASFYNTSYNYYGNSFIPITSSAVYPFDVDSKQGVNVFKIGAGLKSREENEGPIKYDGNVSYNYFTNKYGRQKADDGVKGGIINADLNLYTEFGADQQVGIKGMILNQSFSNKTDYLPNAHHGYTNITGTPYIKFQGANWNADLGANLSALFDVKTAFAISPNVKASVSFYEVNTLYAEVGGGVNNNTFLDILQENRYADPSTRIEYSKTYYDAKIGFRSGVVSGLEFDLFAGYKHVRRDHLYVYNYYKEEGWGNVGSPVYANISTGHIGGLLKTNLIPYTDLSARMTAYFYNVKYHEPYVQVIDAETLPDTKPWGRPTFTAEFNADVNPINNLTLSVNYLYAGGRKALASNASTTAWTIANMKDINELNFRAEYKINDYIAVNGRLNNVLFQKYELQYGYPLQGFNFMAGVSLKF